MTQRMSTINIKRMKIAAHGDMVRVRRAAMALTGLTTNDVARISGTSRATVSAVINGHRRSARIEETLAALWGCPREEVFGP